MTFPKITSLQLFTLLFQLPILSSFHLFQNKKYNHARSFKFNHHVNRQTSQFKDPKRKTSPCNYLNMNSNDDIETKQSCPFSMHYPKYEIPLSSLKSKPNKNPFNMLKTNPFFLNIQKSHIQATFPNSKWIDCTTTQEYQGIYATLQFWKYVIEFQNANETSGVLVLFGLEDVSVYKNLFEIYNWWYGQVEQYDVPNIGLNLVEKDGLFLFEFTKSERMMISSDYDDMKKELEEAAEKRMKSWVQRLLVDLGICPFTKSTNKSGQGLSDVNVPVGKIWYCYSHAKRYDIPQFMYDTWDALAKMYMAGPSGKNGISSILLSVPSYDSNFSFWSGPIFTILQSSVIAAKATHIFGIVCFHPQYATPDGTSWPGFGHMHSVPRLKSWLEKDNGCVLLSNEDIAAGGAWQRRTPHSVVNVLRADQLEKAEKKRSSENLYVRNIHVLVGDGSDKEDGIGNDLLYEYLENERRLS